jgi:hypothetical protein
VLDDAGRPAFRRHPPDPHARNCVELTPSGRRIARARILTRNRISYQSLIRAATLGETWQQGEE